MLHPVLVTYISLSVELISLRNFLEFLYVNTLTLLNSYVILDLQYLYLDLAILQKSENILILNICY